MGANWRAAITVVLSLLQIQALNSVKPSADGVEGQSIDVRCDYPSPDHICDVQLNVSRVTPSLLSPFLPNDFTVDKLHLPLYLTAVMCVAAILCVCLFTLCLLLAVKQRRTSVQHNRETSSDYETMNAGVSTEPQLYCSCPDCTYSPALPPPPDLCSHFNPKLSAVTLGHEYVDLDVTGHNCQYQHLDLSRIEEHVYHQLNGKNSDKDGPGGVKEQIK